MRRCPYCNSIWVYWNWFQSPKDKIWVHKCWNCKDDDWGGYVFSSKDKVRTGIPYWILKLYGKVM